LTDAVLESSRRGAWVEIALSPQSDETPGVGAGAGVRR